MRCTQAECGCKLDWLYSLLSKTAGLSETSGHFTVLHGVTSQKTAVMKKEVNCKANH